MLTRMLNVRLGTGKLNDSRFLVYGLKLSL